MVAFSRRELLRTAGVAGAAAAVTHVGESDAAAPNPSQKKHPQSPEAEKALQSPVQNENVLFFFNEDEAQFVRAAIDRLIPADDKWGGAGEAGVLYYIDHQLASAYGAGAKMYLRGPWNADAPPQQGYQLRYSPAELYHIAIAEISHHIGRQYGGSFSGEL